MSLWHQTWVRVIAWIIGGIVVLIIILIGVAHTPPARRFAFEHAVRILREQGIQLEASSVQYNLAELSLVLDNVVIRSLQAPALPPIARADHLKVDVSLRHLLKGTYYIEAGELRNPSVHVVVAENGLDNLPRPPKKEQKTETDYLIDQFKASGATVRFEDRRQHIDAMVPIGQLTVDGNPATKEHDIRVLGQTSGRISFQDRSLPLQGLTAAVLLRKDDVEIRSLNITVGESTVSTSGKLKNFDDPSYDFKAQTDLSLSSLAGFAGIKQPLSGRVHVELAAEGPLAQMKATARVSGDNLTIERFGGVRLHSEATYDAGAHRIYLNSLNVTAPEGNVQAKGSLALDVQGGESTLTANVRGLNLARVSRTFALPVQLASSATGSISANWPALQYEKASGNAVLRLTPARSVPAKDMLPLGGTLTAKASGNRVVLNIPALETLDARATGQITVTDRRALAGSIRVEASDLAPTIADAEAFLGRKPGTLTGTNVSGPLTLDAKIGGTVQAPTALATLASTGLEVGNLKGVEVNAAVDYAPAQLAIRNANVEWQNQQLVAEGTIGLKGRAPAVALTASTSDISIPTVLAAMNRSDIPASGTLKINATVGGTTKMPQTNVEVAGSDLVAYNERLGVLNARAHMAGDLVTLDELRLTKPQEGGDGTLTATGSYDLQTKQFSVKAESNQLRLTSLTLPNGTPVRAQVELAGSGQGTIDNPALALKISADNIEYGEQKYGSATLAADGANQRADIQATAPKFNLAAKGNIGVKEPYPAVIEIQANGTDLASLPVQLPEGLAGKVTATVRGSGDLKDYERGQATFEVANLDLKWNDQPVSTEGPLVAHYANRTLTVERATIIAQDSRVSLEGTLPLDASAPEGAIKIASSVNLETLAAYLPKTQPVTAKGKISVNGTIAGTLKRIDPNIDIALDNGYLSTPQLVPPLLDLNLRASIRDGVLLIERASTEWGLAKFTAAGEVPFNLLPADLPVELPRRAGPAHLTAELQGIELETIAALPDKVGGTVSARLDVSAEKPDINALTGKLTFPDLHLTLGPLAFQQQGTSTIAFADGIASVEQFQIKGPSTDIRLAGTAGLSGSRPLSLRLEGKLDAALAAAFTDVVRARGETRVEVAVTGPAAKPEALGHIELADAQLSVAKPRVGIDGLNTRIEFAGTRVSVTRLAGTINGGDLSGGGGFDFAGGQIQNANLNMKADGVFMDFPEGLKTVSNIEIAVKDDEKNVLVGGKVSVLEGGFTDDINFDTGVLAALSKQRGLDLTEERNRTLERVRLNIQLVTENPIVVDNNLATAEISADLRVLGTPYETGLSGRLMIEEGGQIRLNERLYSVERGIITFTNERRIEPGLDILATTRVSPYDVRLQISGEPGKTETALTSDPALPEPDILALLITGKTLEGMRGEEYEVARNQVLSYLTGRVGSSVGRTISGATGLSTVRIEPNLIATETNPGARLTLGQRITPKLELIYSMNLVDSSDQVYVLEYELARRFTTRGTRQNDGSLRMDFWHDLRFGGSPEPARTERVKRLVNDVSILGDAYFPEKVLVDKLGAKPGKKYDFFKVRHGVDKVQKLYAKENLLEANVRLRRQDQGGPVNLTLEVDKGPVVEFVFEGMSVGKGLQNRVREIWQGGVFDTQRAEDAIEAIRAELVKSDHLQPKIDYSITEPAADKKRVLFDIQTGPEYHDVEWVFDGAMGVEAETLRALAKKTPTDVYVKPGVVTDMLSRYYHEQGYLDAKVDTPKYELNPQTKTGRVVFPVAEGLLYKIGTVDFAGNTVYDDAKLRGTVTLPEGETFQPVLRERSLEKIRDLYYEHGYNEVETDFEMRRSREEGKASFVFKIAEGRQSLIDGIVVQGNDKVSERLIRSQIEVKQGEVLNLQKVNKSRRNLYNTGAFSLVEIAREEVQPADTGSPAPGSGEGQPPLSDKKPMRLTVSVREIQPFQVRYGAFYDTERGPGGILELENRNSLGSARVVGMRTRYDSQLQEARLYFSQPLLRRFPISTIVSPYIRREKNPETSESSAFNVDRLGLTLQQEARFRQHYILNYGYRIERSRVYDPVDDGLVPIEDIRLRIAALTSTLTRETRDDILDATRGALMSHAFEWSPKVLGSEIRFVKYLGQYFKYVPLQKPKVELFTNEVLRPRLVYAGGIRLGLSTGLGGQELPPSERFYAGGSTTIRGFEQNTVGGISPAGFPEGGEGMLIINNELRFPLVKWFDGVGFLDVGNIYRHASDFDFGNLRKTAGMGIRLRTPWFLLRLDYGFKLDRQPNESRGRLFFGIGQAF